LTDLRQFSSVITTVPSHNQTMESSMFTRGQLYTWNAYGFGNLGRQVGKSPTESIFYCYKADKLKNFINLFSLLFSRNYTIDWAKEEDGRDPNLEYR